MAAMVFHLKSSTKKKKKKKNFLTLPFFCTSFKRFLQPLELLDIVAQFKFYVESMSPLDYHHWIFTKWLHHHLYNNSKCSNTERLHTKLKSYLGSIRLLNYRYGIFTIWLHHRFVRTENFEHLTFAPNFKSNMEGGGQ